MGPRCSTREPHSGDIGCQLASADVARSTLESHWRRRLLADIVAPKVAALARPVGLRFTLVRSLKTVAWRGVTQRRPRSAVTALAVTLGVANVVAVLAVNATIDRGVQRRATLFPGGADAVARPAPEADFAIAREDAEMLRSLPHVRVSTAVLGFDAASPSEL